MVAGRGRLLVDTGSRATLMRSLRPRPGRWWNLTKLSLRDATFLPPLIGIATNWREVWSARASQHAPPVRLRNGQTVFHSGYGWEVIGLLNEVHHVRIYDQELGDFIDGGVIVDIGANIGVVTMNYLSRYPNATVQAYEPNPRTYRILEQNIAAQISFRSRAPVERSGRQESGNNKLDQRRTKHVVQRIHQSRKPRRSRGSSLDRPGSGCATMRVIRQTNQSCKNRYRGSRSGYSRRSR